MSSSKKSATKPTEAKKDTKKATGDKAKTLRAPRKPLLERMGVRLATIQARLADSIKRAGKWRDEKCQEVLDTFTAALNTAQDAIENAITCQAELVAKEFKPRGAGGRKAYAFGIGEPVRFKEKFLAPELKQYAEAGLQVGAVGEKNVQLVTEDGDVVGWFPRVQLEAVQLEAAAETDGALETDTEA